MPYALFSSDAKLSKTYPTEADVWKLAQKSGLVVDTVSEEERAAPRPVRWRAPGLFRPEVCGTGTGWRERSVRRESR